MLSAEKTKQLNEIFSIFAKNDTPGIAAAVIKNDEVIYKNTFGNANLSYGIPVTSESVFMLASVSKQFTAMCIALLEEDGLVSQDDDLRKYFPELPDYGKKLTIKNLIYMTDGLRDIYHTTQYLMGINEDEAVNEEFALELLSNMRNLKFNPGEEWSYSNSAYVLLGMLVQRVTGKHIYEYAEENIFKPLGMKSTFFRKDKTKIIKNLAESYCKFDYLHYTDVLKNKSIYNKEKYCKGHEVYELCGAGQVWSTLDDMILWAKNFYNNKLGKNPQLISDKIKKQGTFLNGDECGYSYGLFHEELSGKKMIFHGGQSLGYNNILYLSPEDNFSMIILSNTGSTFDEIIDVINMRLSVKLLEILEIVQPEKSSEKAEINSASINNPGKYLYNFEEEKTSSIWKIKIEEDKLIIDENATNVYELIPVSENTFKIKESEIICQYEFDNGKIKQLKVVDGETERLFTPFLENILTIPELNEYTGEYYCEQLKTSFIIEIRDGKLFKKNKNKLWNGTDFILEQSIKDYFYYYAPPYIPDYSPVQFLRDENNNINSFIYRDYDGDNREFLIFFKK